MKAECYAVMPGGVRDAPTRFQVTASVTLAGTAVHQYDFTFAFVSYFIATISAMPWHVGKHVMVPDDPRSFACIRSFHGKTLTVYHMFGFLIAQRERFMDLATLHVYPGLEECNVLTFDSCYINRMQSYRQAFGNVDFDLTRVA